MHCKPSGASADYSCLPVSVFAVNRYIWRASCGTLHKRIARAMHGIDGKKRQHRSVAFVLCGAKERSSIPILPLSQRTFSDVRFFIGLKA
ncbi:hypothetical protein B0G73_112248 [Paraburkholderia sp. BL25I1N1]|nr:hypothetical protein B0G73_112248 [Paraburkholderia sp. BL25I1N1]